MPKADLRRILQRMEALERDPRPPGCEKLFGEDSFRIRQGDYRILCVVDDRDRIVEFYEIGHRREVYRYRILPGEKLEFVDLLSGAWVMHILRSRRVKLNYGEVQVGEGFGRTRWLVRPEVMGRPKCERV